MVDAEYEHGMLEEHARVLARRAGLVLGAQPDCPLALVVGAHKVELRARDGFDLDADLVRGAGVFSDPAAQDTGSSAGRSLQAPLFKACGVKKGQGDARPSVLDATGGLGSDSWLLAAAGCRVWVCERHPVVHALLEDGLRRAAKDEPDVAARITLLPCQPAANALTNWQGDAPDVVLLDPMFPAGRKTREKKAMRLLRLVVGGDGDAEDLLAPARQLARRVAVKRPRGAPCLDEKKPSMDFEGKGFRFDVHVRA